MSKRRRLSLSGYLGLTLPRVLGFVLAAALLVWFGGFSVTSTERRTRCGQAYARAANAADSARVDRLRVGGGVYPGTTCENLRERGYL